MDYGLDDNNVNGVEGGSRSSQVPVEGRRPSLRDFLSVVFRRKGIIITVFLLAVVAVFVLNASTPISYESSASVLVSRGKPTSVFDTRYQFVSWEEALNSELEIIRSGQVLEMAKRNLEDRSIKDSQGVPVRLQAGKIRATTPGKSSVVNIGYRSEDPIAARHVTQAVTNSYIEFRHETRRGPEIEVYLQDEIDQFEERLAEWEQRKADYMAEENVVSPADERYFLLEEKKNVQNQLTGVHNEIAERRAQVEVMRRMRRERDAAPDLVVYPFSGPRTKEDVNLEIIARELIVTRSAYYDAASKYTETHPEVQSRRRHVNNLEKALDRELDNYTRHLGGRLEVLLAREASYNQLLEAVSAELAEIPSKEMKLKQIERVINALRQQYDALVRSSIDARIKKSGSADWNAILLTPASQARAIRVHDYIRLAVLPLFSLILGIGMAFLADGLDHSIKDAGDVEEYLGLPVLTSVSPFGGR